MPYGLRKETFENVITATLTRAGFLALEFIGPQANYILEAIVKEQKIDVSSWRGNQPKKVRLTIDYRLITPDKKEVMLDRTITTEHDYEQPEANAVSKETVVSAFEKAVKQNLELLIIQMDEFEQHVSFRSIDQHRSLPVADSTDRRNRLVKSSSECFVV